MDLNDVADVDDERTGNGLDANPLSIRPPFDIEPAHVVLGQNGQRSGILVPANAQSQVRRRASRVVVQPDEARRRLPFKESVQPLTRQP